MLQSRLHRTMVFCGTLVMVFAGGATFAGQIPTSVGQVILNGNGPDPSGSFVVQVDYSIYDGADPGDPLGVTADYQIVFQLTHLGSDGENPALSMGRFTVFGPDLNDPTPYYTSISAIAGVGTKAPSLMDIDPPPVGPNRGEFFFQDGLVQADFDPGNVSHLLVLTTAPINLPSSVVIEGNFTDTVPGVHADTIIELIPEPAMGSLLLMGSATVLRRRRGV